MSVWLKTLFSVLIFALLASCSDGNNDYDGGPGAGPKLQEIRLTPAQATVPAGLDQQYTAIGVYADGSQADISNSVSWSSSDTAIAQVNAAGLATGLSGG